MPAYLDRLRAEHRELETRISKLRAFMTTAKFASLEPGAQKLLAEQKSAMDHYLSVLARRLEIGEDGVDPEIGEPDFEVGGFDIDRDGPIPFNC